MPSANLEVIRQANAAFAAHDVDAWCALCDDDVEVVDHMGAVGEQTVYGLDAIRRQIESWFELFPDFRTEVKEMIDCGDCVVTDSDWLGTARASGLPYHQPAAEIVTIRDGKMTRIELGFADLEAAMRALAT